MDKENEMVATHVCNGFSSIVILGARFDHDLELVARLVLFSSINLLGLTVCFVAGSMMMS